MTDRNGPWILGLLGVALITFLFSVGLRDEWRTTLSLHHHQWLTGSTLVFTRNWYRDGPRNLKFALVSNPRSIEMETLDQRKIYASYPIGGIVPIYALGKVLNTEPSEIMVMIYNLVNHFLVGISLALAVFFILRYTGNGAMTSAILSLVPMAGAYLSPSVMYWLQNVYWADQAVILPFALLVLLEVLRPRIGSVLVGVLLAATVFFACFTDYLGFVIAGTMLGCRVALGDRDYRAMLWQLVLPAAAALTLFMAHIIWLDAGDALLATFQFRTALSAEGQSYVDNFFRQFYLGWIARDFGYTGLVVLAVGFLLSATYLGIRLIRRPATKPAVTHHSLHAVLSMITLLIVPPVVQTWLLKNHSVIHDFSALKFALAYSAFFILLPLAGLVVFNRSFTDFRLQTPFGALPYLPAVVIALFVWHQAPLLAKYREYFPPPAPQLAAQGHFIDTATGYRDVVFSFSFKIPATPPQALAYSMKRVYRVRSFEQALDRLRAQGLYTRARIGFLFSKQDEPSIISRLRGFRDLDIVEDKDYFLIKTEPASLEHIIGQLPESGAPATSQ